MNRLRLFLVALAFAFGLATPAQASKDELVIGITQFPSNFNPNIDSMLAKTYVLSMARRPLTAYDADWKLVCMLCETLPTIENGGAVLEQTPDGKDGIAVTYTIHDGAKWGDGTPLSVDDVLFTWEVGKHPKSGFASTEFYNRVLAIDRVDERTFTLHFDRVTFDYNAVGGFGILPAHLEREAFADPELYSKRSTYETDTTNPGLWYGPYRISRIERGALIELVPNETWWGKPPAFRRVIVRVVENTSALEANLLSGSIDMIAGELGLNLDQAISLEKRRGRDFQILYQPGLIYEHIDLALDNSQLQDVRVRQALLLGIDREAISQRLFDGRQPVAHGNVNPLDVNYAEDAPRYPHDPERATALLAEAGYTNGPDGALRDREGTPLAVELMTTAGNRTRELVQQVIQSQWQELGIATELHNQPARVFFGETVRKRLFPSMAMFAWISSPESVPRTTLHSSMIPTADNNWSGQNSTGYANPEMDALIDALEVELDPGRRREMWADLQTLYMTDLPALPLYWRANAFVLPKWLKGVKPTGHQFVSTLWIEDWRAE